MCTETELQAKTETVFCTTVAFKRKKTVLKQIAGLISPVRTVITVITQAQKQGRSHSYLKQIGVCLAQCLVLGKRHLPSIGHPTEHFTSSEVPPTDSSQGFLEVL